MINIQLIKIGHNDLLNSQNLINKRNSSSIFKFNENELVASNANFLNKVELTIHDDELSSININEKTDFNIGIINRPLDGNYFSRPINKKFIVVSTYDFDTLELHEGISVENYFLRFVYAFSIIYQAYNGLNPQANEIMQDNITGCLFDKATLKKQIATFFKNPHISIAVKHTLSGKTIDAKIISTVENEIKKLKISWYYKYADLMKKNPITATIIIFITSLLLQELGGNFLYDWINGQLCK
nr:hypothetical protein [uncultured Flavobacterium sp.]